MREVEKNKKGKKIGWKGTGYKYKLEQRFEERSGSAVPALSQMGMEGEVAIVQCGVGLARGRDSLIWLALD